MRRLNLSASALLVIDLQRYFFEPESPAFLAGAANVLPYVCALIGAFRGASRPVVFTRHANCREDADCQMRRWWDGKLPWEGDPLAELVGAILPERDEPVVTKDRYSALEGTALEPMLRRQGIDTLVLCGVMTNLCVETTARDAFLKDFQPVIVHDACAGKTPEHHRASLLNLSYGFAFIEATASIIDLLSKTGGA